MAAATVSVAAGTALEVSINQNLSEQANIKTFSLLGSADRYEKRGMHASAEYSRTIAKGIRAEDGGRYPKDMLAKSLSKNLSEWMDLSEKGPSKWDKRLETLRERAEEKGRLQSVRLEKTMIFETQQTRQQFEKSEIKYNTEEETGFKDQYTGRLTKKRELEWQKRSDLEKTRTFLRNLSGSFDETEVGKSVKQPATSQATARLAERVHYKVELHLSTVEKPTLLFDKLLANKILDKDHKQESTQKDNDFDFLWG